MEMKAEIRRARGASPIPDLHRAGRKQDVPTKHSHRDQEALELPFDLFERYELTRRVLLCLCPALEQGEPLQVLDVGGHSSPLKHFVPAARIALADIEPPGSLTRVPLRYDAYVRASGARLPFGNGSFDVTTAHDTLEHVPAESRMDFLHELLRVSRRFVVLNGPLYHPRVAQAERQLDEFLQRALSDDNRFLHEHASLGLPRSEEIEGLLKELGAPFVRIPNGNLLVWQVVNALRNYVRALPDSEVLASSMERAFNVSLASHDFGGLCYRQAYVIAKSPEDAAALTRVEETFAPVGLSGDLLEKLDLDALIDDFGKHAGAVRESFEKSRRAVTRLAATLQGKDEALADQAARLEHFQAEVSRLTSTTGYRLLQRLRAGIEVLAPRGTNRRDLFVATSRAANMVLTDGMAVLLRRAPWFWQWPPRPGNLPASPPDLPSSQRDFLSLSRDDQYQLWLKAHELTGRELRQMRREATRFTFRPKISIIMPAYNSNPVWLSEAIDSVRSQIYPRWELCIADDGSTDTSTRAVLGRYSHRLRIKVVRLQANRGIAAASNAALALATGEYVGLLDHDDELKPDALFEVVKLLNARRDLDYIYSDEDKKEFDGRLVEALFKPDWSPDLLMSVNYVTHFSVYRKQIIDCVGGFRPGYDGSQDYDLVLRVTERTDRVAHIAKPLYSWRKHPGSAAASLQAKEFAIDAGRRALEDAAARRGTPATASYELERGRYRVRYATNKAKIAIIVPTRDGVTMLRRCLETIEARSSYRHYEIVVVDNCSRDGKTLEYLSSLQWRVMRYPHRFNVSKIVNFAAGSVECDALLLLDNSSEVIASDWMEAMLEHGMRPGVAAVGARLLHPNGNSQHEGMIIGIRGESAGNVDHAGYFCLGNCVRNVSAVTDACMLTRASVFRELGGFEEHLGVALGDVDFCLRAREKGYLIVYTPYAALYRHESATSPSLHSDEDERFFRKRWGNPGEYHDPYYNRNLDLRYPFTLRTGDQFSLSPPTGGTARGWGASISTEAFPGR